MNCDQAFDQMTQLGGGSDPALRSHLASCPRCREMRETLSPAIGLFEADARPRQEPWLSGSETGAEVAVRTAVRLTEAAPPRRSRAAIALGYLASILLGAGFVFTMSLFQPKQLAPGAGQSAAVCTYLNGGRTREMAANLVVRNCLACHQVDRQSAVNPSSMLIQ